MHIIYRSRVLLWNFSAINLVDISCGHFVLENMVSISCETPLQAESNPCNNGAHCHFTTHHSCNCWVLNRRLYDKHTSSSDVCSKEQRCRLLYNCAPHRYYCCCWDITVTLSGGGNDQSNLCPMFFLS